MPVVVSNPPRNPSTPLALFARIKNAVLGSRYALSVAFVPQREIRRLNRIYRGKDEPTDILSFPLSKTAGEVLIAPSVARREAKKFKKPFEHFTLFLFIHGLVHLKGMTHGSRMERQERKFRKKFKV